MRLLYDLILQWKMRWSLICSYVKRRMLGAEGGQQWYPSKRISWMEIEASPVVTANEKAEFEKCFGKDGKQRGGHESG